MPRESKKREAAAELKAEADPLSRRQAGYKSAISSRRGIPEISVIISFYGDYCNFGSDCLASLVRQELQNFEIVFIQDGPTEFQGQLQKDLLGSGLNFVYLINSSNVGALESRIRASREALGRYIAFLDHDDAYSDNFLSQMHLAAKEYGVDVVECGINIVAEDGGKELFRRFECGDSRFGRDIVIQYLRGFSHNNLWNKLIVKDRFDAASSELCQDMSTMGWNFFEDLLLVVVLYKNSGSYATTCDTHYNYVQRSGSNANPVEIEKIVTAIRQIVLIADYVNQKLSATSTVRDLRLFHERETRWGLDHMRRRLRLYKPAGISELIQQRKYLIIALVLRYGMVSSQWLASKFASRWRPDSPRAHVSGTDFA